MKIGWKVCIAIAGLFLLITICVGLVPKVHSQEGRGKGDRGRQEGERGIFLTEISEYKENIILGRPTGTSIVLSVLCNSDTRAVVAYGTQPANLLLRTEVNLFKKGEPREILLEKLKPDTSYHYRLLDVTTNKILVDGTFQTQRRMSSPFTFTVTADSHLDQNTDPLLYSRTLANALTDAPDFHIDLGDTFMTDKHETRESAARQYLAQRFYFSQIGRTAALFLALGNHDGEDSKLLWGGADSLAVWSNSMRKLYFPNPAPDGFYTGNVTRDQFAGLLQNYYAWQWGDALFIVLNPYWHSTGRRGSDSWASTLGDTQYQWLKSTLETSKARFKFVFVHQLVGGRDRQGRGGKDAASFGEWGGKNSDGTEGFKEHRPGWDMPIHQLLVRNHVTIVFHGHDHLYAREELGGIVYQEVPQPGFPRAGPPKAAEYGYRDGVILGGSGHIRVTVSPNKVTADYINAFVPKDENAGQKNRQVAHSYTIADNDLKLSPALSEIIVPPVISREQDKPSRSERDARRPEKQKRPKNDAAEIMLPADVATLEQLSLVLGRPTDKSVTLSILSANSQEGYCEYGIASGKYTHKTDVVSFSSGKPTEMTLDKLPRDKQCFYRLRYRKQGDKPFMEGQEHTFHTQRAPGSQFVFEIQGDSHPERRHQFDSTLYAQTLQSVATDRPDFYLTMGDDFSVDTLRTVNMDTVEQRYILQRQFLALVAQTSPLFLVNGNHEQAAACNLDGTPSNVAVWAQMSRNKYFPQPEPDGFYGGDSKPVQFIGQLRDYFAWTWGDALFVVIDPYWHSSKPVDNVFGDGTKTSDKWRITLGEDQYKWLKKTLETSKARFKFVFTHHVLGSGRGGIEQAELFEWGGKNKNGVDEFALKRPGWEMPIHQIMARNGVTIFFQGHDHVFARQELDGVVYQTLPEPADPSSTLYNKESYRSGDVLPNSGRVRVTVSAEKVRVEYVRSYLPKDVTAEHPNGEIAFTYEIAASGSDSKMQSWGKRP